MSTSDRVLIQRLLLVDFRNYRHVDWTPGASVNVLIGRNAQGKTNLLESILFLGLGKSPRTGRDAELIRWGCEAASAAAVVLRGDISGRLQIVLRTDAPKRVTWNDNPLRPRDALGILSTVSFFPDDLYLVKGGPAERRRLLDVLLCQADARYARHLIRLQRILRQRNLQLRALPAPHGDDMLVVWNQQLVEEAAPIMARRAEAVRRLGETAAAFHRRITAGREELRLVYKPFFAGEQDEPDAAWESAEAMARLISRAAARLEAEERRRGVTLVGPQRDDVRIFINGADARTFASQGQQRTAVLALKLAELEFLREETGEYPVLLLDDVLSELDGARRAFLLETVAGNVQTFITTAQPEPLPEKLLVEARVFRVHQGTIAPV
ncbi:MAG: DNA replication/repair protein RecF [Limnochordales bacterium]